MATGTVILPISGALFPAANAPSLAVISARPKLLFDDTTDESCLWTFRMPSNYASAPVLKLQYTMVSGTADKVQMQAAVMAVSDADAADVDTDSYDTANDSAATTVPGTAGYMDELSIALANADSLAAGDYVSVKVNRNADGGAGVDDATGDLELIAVSLEYTTS